MSPAPEIVVWSTTATHIDVCLFDHPHATTETRRVPLIANGARWANRDLILPHGQLYALRARGRTSVTTHAHFEPDRLLLDPYARAIGRTPAPLDPLGAVVVDDFDWAGDAPPRTPWRDTVIYEAHVKGLTAQHPHVHAEHRGTFLGVASPSVIAHLSDLGVTAVELLPVHAHADEAALTARGLTNYWGYNTLSFFAPDPRFATRAVDRDPTTAVREFKIMVRELHRAGIEVILDVVYNHTAEGPPHGPTLSWRGLDPVHTYRRHAHDATAYDDWTGCGNTLNVDDPIMRAMVLDSLRYWVTDMHVDGFRFDLASALDRAPGTDGSFFQDVQNDPVLSQVKLIAEPWDATPYGYQLGAFPAGVREWNGQYRDAVRRFWRGDAGSAPDFATRLSGSQDLFDAPARSPLDSINFVTAHDGFTLADLVSYTGKHNETNGEDSRDGEHNNISSNSGIEGPTSAPDVVTQRRARQRCLLASLFLSQGVPMLSGGDELGRTQKGNNNAYCHDSPISWSPWPGDRALTSWIAALTQLRRAHPCLRRARFLNGDDVRWLSPEGLALTNATWNNPSVSGLAIEWIDRDGTYLLAIAQSATGDASWILPRERIWTRVLDSRDRCDSAPAPSPLAITGPAMVVLTGRARS